MISRAQWSLILGGVNAAIAVALGAAGMHVLRAQLALNDPAGWFDLALQYHRYHALGLMVVGLAGLRFPSSRWFAWAGACLLVGIAFFCGGLYWLSLAGSNPLHAAIPFGGAAFIAAWLLVSIGGIRVARG